MTAESHAQRFSVPVRVRITAVDGHRALHHWRRRCRTAGIPGPDQRLAAVLSTRSTLDRSRHLGGQRAPVRGAPAPSLSRGRRSEPSTHPASLTPNATSPEPLVSADDQLRLVDRSPLCRRREHLRERRRPPPPRATGDPLSPPLGQPAASWEVVAVPGATAWLQQRGRSPVAADVSTNLIYSTPLRRAGCGD